MPDSNRMYVLLFNYCSTTIPTYYRIHNDSGFIIHCIHNDSGSD